MTGLMVTEAVAALAAFAVIVVVATAYPMPSGSPSPLVLAIGSFPMLCVAAGWLACRTFVKRGHTRLALAAGLAPIAAILLVFQAM